MSGGHPRTRPRPERQIAGSVVVLAGLQVVPGFVPVAGGVVGPLRGVEGVELLLSFFWDPVYCSGPIARRAETALGVADRSRLAATNSWPTTSAGRGAAGASRPGREGRAGLRDHPKRAHFDGPAARRIYGLIVTSKTRLKKGSSLRSAGGVPRMTATPPLTS